jgi:hypothetical protein
MADDETAGETTPDDSNLSDDDRRARAAEVNRKRAQEQWEENKKRWRDMGVPAPLPAAGSTKKG